MSPKTGHMGSVRRREGAAVKGCGVGEVEFGKESQWAGGEEQ